MIYTLENEMWLAALKKDSDTFSTLVSENAVMVCGGYRCTGAEYASMIKDFGISEYKISDFEPVLETDNIIQVHYIVATAADCPENSDLAGIFHVTSTWKKTADTWKIIFNMDSRIYTE
ncbi:MAG: nuclear transport factor 2 family protein [Oscillospiraceae bacterium]|nr:nuclear transport factor 2 family protein [Oscillospiraceae bacterium]